VTTSILTVQRLREALRYEPDTGDFFWIAKTSKRTVVGTQAGHLQRMGYVHITVDKERYCAHRLAWLYVYGVWPEKFIDHINGIRSDNRIHNLRDVTGSVNQQNQRRCQKSSTIGTLGVSPHHGKFQARIRLNYKITYLGRFDTPELAHAAYLEAKRKHHAGCTI
jgi:hypothetical protein